MKRIQIVLALIFLLSSGYCQNNSTIAKFKFQEAEELFAKNLFQESLQKLEEVDKILNKTSSTVMYLRIMAQYNLLLPNPLDQGYQLVEDLNKNCAYYLQEYEGKVPEEKLREVYEISEWLKKNTPANKESYDAYLAEKKKKAEEQKRIAEEKRKIEEAEIKRKALEEYEKNKLEQEKEAKSSALAVGYCGGKYGLIGATVYGLDAKDILGIFMVRFNPHKDISRRSDMSYYTFLAQVGATFPIKHPVSMYIALGYGSINFQDYRNVFFPRFSKEGSVNPAFGFLIHTHKKVKLQFGYSGCWGLKNLYWANEINFGLAYNFRK